MTAGVATDLDPASRDQLDAIGHLLRAVLGDAVLGAWLHGSAVLGGLRPASDIDVLAVVARPTTARERAMLIGELLRRSGRQAEGGPARPLELTIVVDADVRPWRYPPRLDFQYGDWWRPAFEVGNLEPWTSPAPDLAVVLSIARLHGRPLLGPAPAALLDPVPRNDLLRAMSDAIPGLLADLETDTANVVLTLARIWATGVAGDIRPKDDAADWALARLPLEHRAVLARARAVYLGETEDRWDDLRARVRPHADHVVHEIRAMTQGDDRAGIASAPPATVVISAERPDTADAAALVLELEEHLASRYPDESRHGFSVERLLAQSVDFFVLRVDGRPAACGGILFVDDEYGELKRMYVRPAYRGVGLGKRLVEQLEAHARAHGVALLRLETGTYQEEAIGLYERMGFRRIPPFGPYTDDPLSRCYEKGLDPA